VGLWKCRIGLIWTAFVVGILVVAVQSLELRRQELERAERSALATLQAPPLPQVQVVEGTIQRHTTLVATLVDLDVPAALAHDLAVLVQPVFDLRKLRPGNAFRLEKVPDGTVRAFEYKVDDERILKVEREEESYAAKIERLDLEPRDTVVTASITEENNNLFAALDGNPKGADLAEALAAIFAWDIDFNSDLQRNDQLRIVVPALYHEGAFVKWGKIQAAELVNSGKSFRAFLFQDGYYDASANALKRSFLISPLKVTRVSSGFTRRRMHPILGTNRPHLAVDYAAPTGTPVQAIANGTIVSAGWSGGYGNLVQIKHKNGLMTGYAHLSRIDSDVRAGRHITQGDTVGAVGQTGLATGPHLHFMMTEHGRPINPASKKSEPPVPIDAKLKPEFLALIAPLEAQLEGRDTVTPANPAAVLR
jgi:murein DD-endopeptidase MepM/ murein hydrolase activator NlpD